MDTSAPLRPTESPPVEADLRQAVALHRAGQVEEAARAYLSILQARPDHPEANYQLGTLAVQTGHVGAALPYFNAALDADPTRGAFWLGYIDALFQAGLRDDARQVLALARQHGLHGDDVEALARRLAGTAMPEHTPDDPESAGKPSAGHDPTRRKPAPRHAKAPGAQDMNTLVSLVGQGRLEEAAALAQALTARAPLDGLGWKASGTVLTLLGRNQDALLPLQKAIALMPPDPELHNSLGIALLGLGRLDEAAASFRSALALRPEYAQAHCNLGVTLHEAGQSDEALASYRRALQIDPGYAKARCNLGAALQAMDRLDEAETCYRQVLQASPESADAHYNLGVLLHASRRFGEAETHLRRALEIAPNDAKAFTRLGVALDAQARHAEAEAQLRRALAIDPTFADAHCSLAHVLAKLNRLDEAASSFRQALPFTQDPAGVHTHLGSILEKAGRLQEAEADCRCALALKPDHADAHVALGNTFVSMGRLQEAEASYRRSLEITPSPKVHSNLLFMLNYASRATPSQGLAEAMAYGQALAGIATRFTEWPCERQPDRLRVGMVSGDFRSHPVGYFLEGLLAHLDPSTVDLVAYPTDLKHDALTKRLRPHFSAWKPLDGLSDDAAARMIHEDGLHVLFDLSGHTAGNRLPVFARKPAPVQVSWLGYFATTGVSAMDYLLGDPYVTPAGEAGHFSESIWQLPASYLCFTEPDVAPDVAPLPALSTGHVTFGSFNNLTKMNDAVVAAWAEVLKGVPRSRLFLKAPQLGDSAVRAETLKRFSTHGIAPERLILEGRSPRAELLAAYRRVDVALDTFPYPGGTTSIESLWMGVPVITRRGDRFLSHVGESIARNAGLAAWIAADDAEYVAKAVACASDLDRLARLRAGLREQMRGSPLLDAASFARHFNEALWRMWQRWSDRQNGA